jgi:hypothetical protein
MPHLDRESLECLQALAAPVPADRLDDFVIAVASGLATHPETGPGLLHRVAAALQPDYRLIDAAFGAAHELPETPRRGRPPGGRYGR